MSFFREKIYIVIALCTVLFCSGRLYARDGFAVRDYVQFNAIGAAGDYAPYWLVSNRGGLSSLDTNNGFARYGVGFDGIIDGKGNWRYSSGLDLKAGYNQAHKPIIYQLYADVSYKWLTLSIGAKERGAEMRDFCRLDAPGNSAFNTLRGNSFSSLHELGTGGLVYSGNSTPIPQVRIGAPEYVTVKGTNSWLKLRGHIAYGMFMDGNFQEDFTAVNPKEKYNKHVLYHSKAMFIKVGNENKFPLEVEGGLEMHSQFGGDVYTHAAGKTLAMPARFIDFFKAFIPLGGDNMVPYTEQSNITGNQIGNWHMAFTLHTKPVDVELYGEHMFEDFSQLFFLEYQSNKEGVRRVIFYPWKDILVGVRITNKSGVLPFISALQYEYMGTYDQSGALYHDPSVNFNEQMDGVDNYYNHGIYPGWHHWGMGIGNPLVISPSYNNDGDLAFKSNRVKAHNVGINGNFGKRYPFAYRLQYTYSVNWGTYLNALEKKAYSNSLLGELVFAPRDSHWAGSIAVGYDNSNFIGNNFGVMISIVRAGSINFSKKK